jgi:CHAD domain-containing protein
MSTYAEAAVHPLDDTPLDLPVELGAPEACQRVWYDTFDWRLYRAKATLLHDVLRNRVRLLPPGSGATTRAGTPPRYADDAPAVMRPLLTSIARQRALLPRLVVAGEEQRFKAGAVHGAVGRYHTVDPETGAETDLGTLLWLTGPPRAVAALRVRWGLPKKKSLLKLALRAVERRPGDYSRRIKVQIDPAAPTGEAGKAALATVFTGFERNLPGVLRDLDADFLKDLRVAVRRSRAAIDALRKAWPTEQVEPLRAGLKWVGAVTTPVRDLDVYLQRLPLYQAELPADLQPALAPLGGLLRTLRAPSQAALETALTSPGFARLLQQWRDFLTDPTPSKKRFAARPIAEVARERTARIYRAFCEEGRAITTASPAEQLHALRKTGKALRYMLEFFRSVHPPDVIKPAIKQMRRLQSHLGEFNDVSIQYTTLGAHAERLKACGAPAETLTATAALIRQLRARERAERLVFAPRWAEFDGVESQAVFAAVFAHPPLDE